jgi:hypothetical protein
VGAENGYGPPDVTVRIQTGDLFTSASSTIVQDDYYPTWGEVFSGLPTAELASLFLEVADADVIFSDSIGYCWLPADLVNGATSGRLALACDPAALHVSVTLTPYSL